MKTNFVSINNPILEWIQDADLKHDEIEEPLFKRWATDCLGWMNSDEQLVHRIALLSVENSRAEMPDDFKMLSQAAANPFVRRPCDCSQHPLPDCCKSNSTNKYTPRLPKSRREDIVQWVQGTLEKDCELEINLNCPKCHKITCDCDTPVVEVDVDRVWEMAHPEIYYRHHMRIGRFGYGSGPWSSYYTPKFKLMRYASGDYWNLQHFLGGCPNVNCNNCIHEFKLNLPYIEVDFQEGEVLVSYLGRRLDDNGDLMIPDHPSVHAAIFWHLEHKWFWRMYRRTSDQKYFNISQIAEGKRENEIGIARAALEIPEFAQFKNYLDNQWYKRIPNFHNHENMNELTLGEREKYDRLLG